MSYLSRTAIRREIRYMYAAWLCRVSSSSITTTRGSRVQPQTTPHCSLPTRPQSYIWVLSDQRTAAGPTLLSLAPTSFAYSLLAVDHEVMYNTANFTSFPHPFSTTKDPTPTMRLSFSRPNLGLSQDRPVDQGPEPVVQPSEWNASSTKTPSGSVSLGEKRSGSAQMCLVSQTSPVRLLGACWMHRPRHITK